MRAFIVGLLLIGVASAIAPSNEYLPPFAAPSVQRTSFAAPSREYLSPLSHAATNTHASFAPAPQSFVPRPAPVSFAASNAHASFAPAPQPLAAPSIQRSNFAAAPLNEYLPPFASAASEPAAAHSLANDGYHYKAGRRYRRKRNVEYLPPLASEKQETFVGSPSKQSNTIIAPAEVSAKATLEEHSVSSGADSYAAAPSGQSSQLVASQSAPVAAHTLENDGYHYRTVKRYRLRRRY